MSLQYCLVVRIWFADGNNGVPNYLFHKESEKDLRILISSLTPAF